MPKCLFVYIGSDVYSTVTTENKKNNSSNDDNNYQNYHFNHTLYFFGFNWQFEKSHIYKL